MSYEHEVFFFLHFCDKSILLLKILHCTDKKVKNKFVLLNFNRYTRARSLYIVSFRIVAVKIDKKITQIVCKYAFFYLCGLSCILTFVCIVFTYTFQGKKTNLFCQIVVKFA